jgi:5-formyltetrahydrofolate cyclo-ligase
VAATFAPGPELDGWRAAERSRLLAQRAGIPLAERREMDARVTDRLLQAALPVDGASVGFYWPMKGEFDPRVLVLRWREQGARAALPVVIRKAAPLEFREWWPDVPTAPGVFNLPVPQGTSVLTPDVVLVPPVGFDARGFRLGYGGGYFDRTLAAISPRPLAIAVAREASRMDTIHPQAWDIPMDFVATESALYEVASAGLREVDGSRLREAFNDRAGSPRRARPD